MCYWEAMQKFITRRKFSSLVIYNVRIVFRYQMFSLAPQGLCDSDLII